MSSIVLEKYTGRDIVNARNVAIKLVLIHGTDTDPKDETVEYYFLYDGTNIKSIEDAEKYLKWSEQPAYPTLSSRRSDVHAALANEILSMGIMYKLLGVAFTGRKAAPTKSHRSIFYSITGKW